MERALKPAYEVIFDRIESMTKSRERLTLGEQNVFMAVMYLLPEAEMPQAFLPVAIGRVEAILADVNVHNHDYIKKVPRDVLQALTQRLQQLEENEKGETK